MSSSIPTARESINLKDLLTSQNHPTSGNNSCVCVSVKTPKDKSHNALLNGIRKILPFMYQFEEDVIKDLKRYGFDFSSRINYFPTSPDFQKAHLGEIFACAYLEECENKSILTYKWRMNTTRNQHQFGMDILAFDFNSSPIKIYAIAVKTTYQGANGKTPGVFGDAVSELEEYVEKGKLDNDLVVTSANLHVDNEVKTAFENWYNPYSQKVPQYTPELILVPIIVVDENNWQDKFAHSTINHDFGMPSFIRILQIQELECFVGKTYSGGTP